MVDVQGQNVLVNVLDHDEVLLALELELENSVDAVCANQCGQLETVNSEVQNVNAVAVDNAWDLASNAQAASEALAELVTYFCLQYWAGVCHSKTPSVKDWCGETLASSKTAKACRWSSWSSHRRLKTCEITSNRVDNGFPILGSPRRDSENTNTQRREQASYFCSSSPTTPQSSSTS